MLEGLFKGQLTRTFFFCRTLIHCCGIFNDLFIWSECIFIFILTFWRDLFSKWQREDMEENWINPDETRILFFFFISNSRMLICKLSDGNKFCWFSEENELFPFVVFFLYSIRGRSIFQTFLSLRKGNSKNYLIFSKWFRALNDK